MPGTCLSPNGSLVRRRAYSVPQHRSVDIEMQTKVIHPNGASTSERSQHWPFNGA